MKTVVRALIIAAATVSATPALAADALPSFNGVNGNGGFTYGSTNGVTLTAFNTSVTTNGPSGPYCALNGPTTCLHDYSSTLPQASIGGSYPTVSVPSNAVLLHPGDTDALSVYSAYLAPMTSSYAYNISLQSVGTDTTTGIGYTPFTSTNGVVTLGTRGVLGTYLSSTTLSGTTSLLAGQSFGVIIDRNGSYYGDSTALNFSILAVPEPASWAMMLTGFGMVGFGLRSRKRQVVKVTFA